MNRETIIFMLKVARRAARDASQETELTSGAALAVEHLTLAVETLADIVEELAGRVLPAKEQEDGK